MRRLVTVPIFILIALALVITSPVWVIFTSLYELTFGRGNRFSRLRTLMMITTFFVLEGVGVLIALFLWIVFIGRSESSAFTRAHLKLQWWWTTTNFATMQRIFNLGLQVENADVGSRPLFAFCSSQQRGGYFAGVAGDFKTLRNWVSLRPEAGTALGPLIL